MKKLIKQTNSREQNKRYKTLIKNDKKRIVAASVSKKDNNESLSWLLRKAQSNLDKSVTKKIIHKNNAARRKSALFRILNSTK